MTAPHYHSHVDDPAAVGRRLKEARIAAGLSQRGLAFTGCSAAYVSRLEAGDRVPSLQLLRKLAEKLGADEHYLATGVERIEPDPPERVEAEVERRLSGEPRRTEAGRPTGGLVDAAERARVLWAHSRSLQEAGDRAGAARYARDSLALLDFADDRNLASIG
ncbi:MAG: helix-turn-helix domain-containing protein [Actinomycetota bacterium]|nr:helix-turn-helix domain-containing protein [Actinomycetota bacterium]